jgi:hypothetical protein
LDHAHDWCFLTHPCWDPNLQSSIHARCPNESYSPPPGRA